MGSGKGRAPLFFEMGFPFSRAKALPVRRFVRLVERLLTPFFHGTFGAAGQLFMPGGFVFGRSFLPSLFRISPFCPSPATGQLFLAGSLCSGWHAFPACCSCPLGCRAVLSTGRPCFWGRAFRLRPSTFSARQFCSPGIFSLAYPLENLHFRYALSLPRRRVSLAGRIYFRGTRPFPPSLFSLFPPGSFAPWRFLFGKAARPLLFFRSFPDFSRKKGLPAQPLLPFLDFFSFAPAAVQPPGVHFTPPDAAPTRQWGRSPPTG